MNSLMKRVGGALLLIALSLAPVSAQQVAAHAIPIGKGPGVVGFGSVVAAANTKFLVGGGTSSDPVMQTMSGDCSLVAGAVTCGKSNSVTVPSSGTSGGVPYYSSSSAISSSAALTANRIVVGGGAGVAPSVLGSLGTTTTLLHGNAAGAPTFGSVVSGDLNITTTTCTNQFLTAISAAAAGTCTTDALAGAQHANQGTTTQVLHGNAAGNPSWGQVAIGSDVSGLGTGVGTFLATASSANAAAALTDETGTNKIVFSDAPQLNDFDLGNTDTTFHRVSAGRVSIEGVNVPTISSTDTLTNKSLTSPITTGTADVQQALLWSGDISPTQIVANTNDYAPTGFSTATTLRLNTDASRNITGLAGGAGGRIIVIHNVGSFNIVLTNQDGASTAGNRFLFGGDVTLGADTSITVKYDTTSSRWRAITSPGSGAGGSGVTGVTIAAGNNVAVAGTCAITTSGTCTVSLASLTANSVLLGNGTSAIQTVAPSTTGNVLMSNGTTWVSATRSVVAAAVSTASGSSWGITTVPAWATEIDINLSGFSTNGTAQPLVRIGPTGGLQTTGYLGSANTVSTSATATTYTAGFGLAASWAGAVIVHGRVVLQLLDATNNIWTVTSDVSQTGTPSNLFGSGSVSLGAGNTLTQAALTTTDTGDAGTVSFTYK